MMRVRIRLPRTLVDKLELARGLVLMLLIAASALTMLVVIEYLIP